MTGFSSFPPLPIRWKHPALISIVCRVSTAEPSGSMIAETETTQSLV